MNPCTLVAVTGARAPYIFDLPHLLSLPTGFEFRFRYRHRWVERALVDQLAANPGIFVDQDLVLLFHSAATRTLLPVRRAKVVEIAVIGPMIYVRFRVAEFPMVDVDLSRYPEDTPTLVETRKNALQAAALGCLHGNDDRPLDLSKDLPEEHYLRCLPAMSREKIAWNTGDAPEAAWAKVAAMLHQEPSLSGIPLFFLMGFRDESGESIAPQAIMSNFFKGPREHACGYKLVESERYRMRVLEWSEPQSTASTSTHAIRVKCEHNKQQLELEGASDLVVGRYDLIEFTLVAVGPGASEIALRAEPTLTARHTHGMSATITSAPVTPAGAAEDPLRWPDWPEIFVARVPIQVIRKMSKTILALVLVCLSLVAYACIPKWIGGDPLLVGTLQSLALLPALLFAPLITGSIGSAVKLRADFKKLELPGADK